MKAIPRNALLIFFALLIGISSARPQDPPIKWGEIPKTDLEMKSFPPDTNAAAVILCDYGETTMDNELNLVFKRHTRIKILSTRGYDWGTHSVMILENREGEQIYNIEGVTYSLNEEGEVVEKELDDDDIFKETMEGDIVRYRFTLPGLTPGCVIEMRYTILAASFGWIRDWTFQWSEPILWSEYRVLNPKTIAYNGVLRGYERVFINEQKEVLQVFGGTALVLLGNNPIPCNLKRWVLKNAPAIRPEPYITTTDDYVMKVDLQLAAYVFLGESVKRVLNTWENVVQELHKSESFGGKIDVDSDIRDRAEQIVVGLPTPFEKMKAIYSWVATSIVWNESFRRSAVQDVDEVLESKNGNNAEITFLLISLLRAAGLQADPVILSTRSNGRIQELYPIVSQFNYVLARVKIGYGSYLLDATDPLRPFDVLPTSVLNVKGLVIQENKVEWVPITATTRSVESSLANLTIGESGSIRGSVSGQFREYGALRVRRQQRDKKKETEIAKAVLDLEGAGIAIDSATVEGHDTVGTPVTINGWISSDTYVQSVGDLIYVNPHIIGRMVENPFKPADRLYPIDYAYRREMTNIVRLVLPEGYEVKEKFSDRSFYMPNSDAVFTRRLEINERQVEFHTRFEIRKVEFQPQEYLKLKDFYSNVVSCQSDQLVLAKTPPPPVQVRSPVKKAASKSKGKP